MTRQLGNTTLPGCVCTRGTSTTRLIDKTNIVEPFANEPNQHPHIPLWLRLRNGTYL